LTRVTGPLLGTVVVTIDRWRRDASRMPLMKSQNHEICAEKS
jgi:hypothetical protein